MNDEGLQIFSDEAEDLLQVAEQALLNLDDLTNDTETRDGVDDLFRTFHTIKGAAGLFGLDTIVEFTHVVESVLGKIRENELSLDEALVSLFLLSRDHLEVLVENALNGIVGISGDIKEKDDELIKQLNQYLDVKPDAESSTNLIVQDLASTINKEGVDSENWHISLRFSINALRNGMDPASFISYLNKIGELKGIAVLDDAIPAWSDFDAESCYLGFELELYAPTTNKEELAEVFEFVQDDCKICILPPHSHINAYITLIEQLPEQDLRIGDILVACGALTPLEKEGILNVQDGITDQVITGEINTVVPVLGKIAVEQKVVDQAVVDAAVKKQNTNKKNRSNEQQTIRVNALKLENLVNLVGELVIGSANADINSRRFSDANMNEAMENLLRLVEEVRDTALGLRMVPIGETFSRYKRVVREVSRDLGKDIELRITGEDTELDKTLIEKIGDPLMHLVRNAIDHGIESPDERSAMGKPSKGTVNLDAFHESGSIIIRIKDDGRGLQKTALLNKAREKGLIQPDQQLTDPEIYQLIFAAGFSTAEKVSNLSGRGVGMDVVRQNIESLRGSIEIASEEGFGSTISIRLPLTLAIIDGFQVRIGDGKYILPLDMIEECLELDESLRGENKDANYVNLRGEILPFMHLSAMFCERESHLDGQRDNIVVVKCAGKKAGFVVDELLGEHQTVIKPLGKVFQNIKGISGATILGSGEVAMVIDTPAMINMVINSGQSKFATTKIVH
ncbi:MAG: two-component system chemotaxis sensor kinase CheA [Alteromonadaceae bacterium]|jgi:two-component system chemotaxis sensor kinase CheA